MQRVVIGLSGGVDSSVAAYLLKEQGYEVVGLFMINWHDTTGTLEGDCPWHDDRVFAELVARRLDIPFHVVDLSEEYRRRVVDYMFAEYERGRTPNPDVLCNREIKFDVFLKEALRLGADFVATGHYCRRECVAAADGTEHYRLLAGVDGNKDQSYFLCQLSQEQLSRALFPVGGLTKPEVRRIAEEQHLATARRKDSQGICFVGKVDLPVFLQQKLAARKGNVHEIRADWPKYARTVAPDDLPALAEPWRYTVRDGKKIGEHNGAHFYTVGQRKGLGIGGRRESLFVLATDVGQNVIYVGEGDAHPGLYRKALFMKTGDLHWIDPAERMRAGQRRRFRVRIRYRQPLQGAELVVCDEGGYLLFDEPQRGVTPGQFAVWYDGETLVGSAATGRSLCPLPDVEDIAVTTAVATVLLDLLFQSFDEMSGERGVVVGCEKFPCAGGCRFVVVFRPAGIGQDEVGDGTVSGPFHAADFARNVVDFREVVAEESHFVGPCGR